MTSSSRLPTLKLALSPKADLLGDTKPPNLMPFHIRHTGKAPIGMYFRVKDAPSTVGGPSPSDPPWDAAEITDETASLGSGCKTGTEKDASSASPLHGSIERSDSQATVLAHETSALSVTDFSSTIAVDASMVTVSESTQSIPPSTSTATGPGTPSTSTLEKDKTKDADADLPKRYVSAFRGRQTHGLDTKIPEGYTGVVLRSTSKPTVANATGADAKRWDTATGKGKGKGKDKPRSTRSSSRRSAKVIDVDDDDMAVDTQQQGVDEEDADSDGTNVKELLIASTFSSIRLWGSDIPVMEKEDLYARSMREWTGLAALIHEYD